MEAFDEQAIEEQTIDLTYIEFNGVKEEAMGFNVNQDHGTYSLNFDLTKSGPLVRSLATAFIDQATVTITVTEGSNSMLWADCEINSMYGFRSFGTTTSTKPTIK